jgi:hypothetical protein
LKTKIVLFIIILALASPLTGYCMGFIARGGKGGGGAGAAAGARGGVSASGLAKGADVAKAGETAKAGNYGELAAGRSVVVKTGAKTVSLLERPDFRSKRVAEIKSGDSIQVLKLQPEWVEVIGPNGVRGWVQQRYLESSGHSLEATSIQESKRSPNSNLAVPPPLPIGSGANDDDRAGIRNKPVLPETSAGRRIYVPSRWVSGIWAPGQWISDRRTQKTVAPPDFQQVTSGQWICVPGHWVSGIWMPEQWVLTHRAQNVAPLNPPGAHPGRSVYAPGHQPNGAWASAPREWNQRNP